MHETCELKSMVRAQKKHKSTQLNISYDTTKINTKRPTIVQLITIQLRSLNFYSIMRHPGTYTKNPLGFIGQTHRETTKNQPQNPAKLNRI